MKQAKLITQTEFKRLSAVIDSLRHSTRNQTAVALSFYAGLRACEISALRVRDVFDHNGTVKDTVYLSAAQPIPTAHLYTAARVVALQHRLWSICFNACTNSLALMEQAATAEDVNLLLSLLTRELMQGWCRHLHVTSISIPLCDTSS